MLESKEFPLPKNLMNKIQDLQKSLFARINQPPWEANETIDGIPGTKFHNTAVTLAKDGYFDVVTRFERKDSGFADFAESAISETEKAIIADMHKLLNDMRDGLHELFDASRKLHRRFRLTHGEHSTQAKGYKKLMDIALEARTPLLGFTSNYELTDDGYVSTYRKPNKSRPAK